MKGWPQVILTPLQKRIQYNFSLQTCLCYECPCILDTPFWSHSYCCYTNATFESSTPFYCSHLLFPQACLYWGGDFLGGSGIEMEYGNDSAAPPINVAHDFATTPTPIQRFCTFALHLLSFGTILLAVLNCITHT